MATEEEADSTEDEALTAVHVKCIKQLALSAGRNARFLSSPQRAGRFSAKSVS